MNVVLVTRCGCRQTTQISANEPPPGIQMELDVPKDHEQVIRRFSYVGDHQLHQTPMYLEDLPPEGNIINAEFEVENDQGKLTDRSRNNEY